MVAAPQLAPGCGDVGPVSLATQQGTFGGAAAVDLTLACGDLKVTTAPGSGWLFEAGNASGAVPAVARLGRSALDRPRRAGVIRSASSGAATPGSSRCPPRSTLDVAAEVNAGRGRFDLAGAQLGNLGLAVNAGEMRVDLTGSTVAHLSMRVNAAAGWLSLPAAQDTIADLTVNAGSLKICAPSEVGLRIHQAGVLSSITDVGLVRNGDTWESPGYSMAIHHADVTITVNVGSVDVNPTGRLSVNPRRLYRCRHDRQLAGVAAGMAEYLDLDPTLVRILWILSVFFGGFTILLYIVLAFVIPLEPASGVPQRRRLGTARPSRRARRPRGRRRGPMRGRTFTATDGVASTWASCSSCSGRSPWPTR